MGTCHHVFLCKRQLTACDQLNLFHVLSMVTAVVSCLRFYKILKSELVGHKPLSKLFAFKLMVGINFLMTVSHCSRFLRGSQATHTEGNTLFPDHILDS